MYLDLLFLIFNHYHYKTFSITHKYLPILNNNEFINNNIHQQRFIIHQNEIPFLIFRQLKKKNRLLFQFNTYKNMIDKSDRTKNQDLGCNKHQATSGYTYRTVYLFPLETENNRDFLSSDIPIF